MPSNQTITMPLTSAVGAEELIAGNPINDRLRLISFFMPSLHGGGAERIMLNLAAGLADQGYAVEFVLAQEDGQLLSEVPSNVTVVGLGGKVQRSCRAVFWPLVSYLRTRRPSVLLAAVDSANIVAMVANLVASRPTRVVVSLHNHTSRNLVGRKSFRTTLYKLSVRYLYQCAQAIVAVSQGVAKDFADFSGSKAEGVDVIYNPVVTKKLLKMAKEPVSHPWFNDVTCPVLMGVGRLTEQKDFANLINAVAIVHKNRPVRLVIFGEGDLRSELEQLIRDLDASEYIQLPGFTGNPFAHMARTDLFVLSSRWEGLPTVLIEALASGAPVVATDCPSGPREILDGGKFGELVPVGDPQSLANAIEHSLSRPKYMRIPLKESFEPFITERVVNEYLAVFAKAMAR